MRIWWKRLNEGELLEEGCTSFYRFLLTNAITITLSTFPNYSFNYLFACAAFMDHLSGRLILTFTTLSGQIQRFSSKLTSPTPMVPRAGIWNMDLHQRDVSGFIQKQQQQSL